MPRAGPTKALAAAGPIVAAIRAAATGVAATRTELDHPFAGGLALGYASPPASDRAYRADFSDFDYCQCRGLRHALNADHIAAIDNSVRRLLHDGRPASKAGLYFALGHSTVVVIAASAVAAFASALHGPSDEAKHVGSMFTQPFQACFCW